jgi:stage IV sporulation protein A
VVNELKSINKPFIMILNSKTPDSKETLELRRGMEEKYDVPVQEMDILNMKKKITSVFERVLKEFPIKEINIDMPEWIEKLDTTHWLKKNFTALIKDMCQSVYKVRDVKSFSDRFGEIEFLQNSKLDEINMGEGTARLQLNPKGELFYKVLSEVCDRNINSESELLSIMKTLSDAKTEFDKIEEALRDVKERGYGLVSPQLNEMRLEEPEIVKQGNRYAVKLKASAPSLHFIKADIQTEISPIMGTERESEELVKSLLEQFESDPAKIWESNMFGKSLEVLVKDGLRNKLYKMQMMFK